MRCLFALMIILFYTDTALCQDFLPDNTFLPAEFLFDFDYNFSRLNPDTTYHNRILTGFYYNQVYLERANGKTLNNIYNWRQDNQVRNKIMISGQPVIFNSSADQTYKNITVASKDQIITFKRHNLIVKTVPQTSLFNDRLTLSVGLGGIKRSPGWEMIYDLGLKYKFSPWLELGYSYKNDPLHWQLKVEDSNIPAEIDFFENNRRHSWLMRFKYLRWQNRIYFQYTRTNQNNRTKKNSNMIAPRGNQYNFGFKTSINHLFNLDETGIVYQDFYTQRSGNFYSNRLTFGKFTNLETQQRLIEINTQKTFQTNQFGFALSGGTVSFAARGYMDTWPFTESWIDLLGLRSYLNSAYNYDFYVARFDVRHSYRTKSFLQAQLKYEQLYPVGELRTWQPQFLVFGIKNLEINNLDIKRQDGIYLQLMIKHLFNDWFTIRYNLSQYIPVYTQKRKQTDISGTGRKLKDHLVYGGGRHLIQLEISL